jgi:hypothetical protein
METEQFEAAVTDAARLGAARLRSLGFPVAASELEELVIRLTDAEQDVSEPDDSDRFLDAAS